ncbi:MAG TPA: GNAT family N-acetyltransferase [Herpetosiphonaceae bacterium]
MPNGSQPLQSPTVSIVERVPTVEEYLRAITAVGWRRREQRAVELALSNSLYAVCAQADDQTVGFGRVIGDGGLHLYLTDVVVVPEYQGRGIGSRIVAALTRFVEAMPYRNLIVGVMPTPGLQRFYERHGYKAQPPHSPAMSKWINRSDE